MNVSVPVCIFDEYYTGFWGWTMAKPLAEAQITTPAARSRLADGTYFRRIDADVHLGYRKGKRAAFWLVRWREGGRYQQKTIGTADDVLKVGTLSFSEAETKARAVVETGRIAAKAAADGPVLTVRVALEAYIATRDAREAARKGREVRSDASQRLGRWVLGTATRGEAPPPTALAEVALHELTEDDLATWLSGLPSEMKATTRVRLASDMRAAINACFDANRRRLPATVPDAVRQGLRVEAAQDEVAEMARDNQILADGEIRRLLSAAKAIDDEMEMEGDLYRLLLVMAGTGMRFSQVARMRLRDVQRANCRLLVPASRKGRGKAGFVAVQVGLDVLDALVPVTTGRAATDWLLERWRYGQAPGSIVWIKDRRGPWESSSEFSRQWQKIKERAGLPRADPYCFRHSSIVRGIRSHQPLSLVAKLHDTSIAMIEKHYARWIIDGLEELAGRAVVPMVAADDGNNVVQISGARP